MFIAQSGLRPCARFATLSERKGSADHCRRPKAKLMPGHHTRTRTPGPQPQRGPHPQAGPQPQRGPQAGPQPHAGAALHRARRQVHRYGPHQHPYRLKRGRALSMKRESDDRRCLSPLNKRTDCKQACCGDSSYEYTAQVFLLRFRFPNPMMPTSKRQGTCLLDAMKPHTNRIRTAPKVAPINPVVCPSWYQPRA